MKNTFSAYVRLSQTRTRETMQAAFQGSRAGRSTPVPGQGDRRYTKPPPCEGTSWRWCWGDHTASDGARVQRACYGLADHVDTDHAGRVTPLVRGVRATPRHERRLSDTRTACARVDHGPARRRTAERTRRPHDRRRPCRRTRGCVLVVTFGSPKEARGDVDGRRCRTA